MYFSYETEADLNAKNKFQILFTYGVFEIIAHLIIKKLLGRKCTKDSTKFEGTCIHFVSPVIFVKKKCIPNWAILVKYSRVKM